MWKVTGSAPRAGLVSAIAACLPSAAFAWGAMHGSITQGALSVLPPWQQEVLAPVRKALIDTYCMIPDLAQAPAYKKEFGPLVVLPDGMLFSHLPLKTRAENAFQIKYYLDTTVKALQAGEIDAAARWLGCLLHFLEDSGSPAHTMPGDNQMGLMKDLLPTPEPFRARPSHSLIEEGKLWVGMNGYQPCLLGATTDEMLLHLMERYDAMVRNARGQVIPILQATYAGKQTDIDAGQLRAATFDAEVAADAIYTLVCIAKGRFEAAQVSTLDEAPLESLTPQEVIRQSYWPQHLYFSDPYFGFPIRDAILDGGKEKRELRVKMGSDGGKGVEETVHGFGLGTGCRMTFALPVGVFQEFTCVVGRHADLGQEGKAVFKILADDKVVFDSGILGVDFEAQFVRLPMANARTLAIVSESRNTERGHNYLVIGNPVLHRTKDAARLADMSRTPIANPSPPPSSEMLAKPVARKTE